MKRVIIIGGGPAGLMAATQLLKSDCEILLLDQKASVGRKFLVAGDGGFNLTHAEAPSEFREKYDSDWIRQAVKQFSNKDWIKFLKQIGIETKIGSSGKIFPEDAIKPIQVLYIGFASSSICPPLRCSLGKPMRAFNPVTYSVNWIRCFN